MVIKILDDRIEEEDFECSLDHKPDDAEKDQGGSVGDRTKNDDEADQYSYTNHYRILLVRMFKIFHNVGIIRPICVDGTLVVDNNPEGSKNNLEDELDKDNGAACVAEAAATRVSDLGST